MKFLIILTAMIITSSVRGVGLLNVRIKAEGSTDSVIVGYTKKFTSVSEMTPEITFLAQLDEGNHKLDISQLPEKTQLLYFFSEGYAPLFVPIRNSKGLLSSIEASLYHKQYLTIRYSENPSGPELAASLERRIALTQYTYPKEGGAWQIKQWGDRTESGKTPWITYWQGNYKQWGAISSSNSFDDMVLAPLEGYRCGEYPLRKGMKFYMKNTPGYSKMEVLDISETRPLDAEIIEFYPTFLGIPPTTTEEWESSPKKYKGTEISIEVGSVRKAYQAPSKEGFQAYEIIRGKRIEKKSYGEIVTTTSCGPISFVYVADLALDQFEADYTAKGEHGTTIEGNSNPDDANRIWTLPKGISGILWKIHDEWVLVYK